MEITLLIKSILGLVVILAILIFLLFFSSKQKKQAQKAEANKASFTQRNSPNTSLDYLVSIVKNKKSTTKELKEALDLVLKHHGRVHEKLGMRSHPDFDVYKDLLFRICRHPNTNKDIVVKFDRELGRLNPDYKKDINEAVTKGLNSRRV
ncbi:hypothetical protein [Sulfurimonas sp.]|uniref:hypothetical protein n=1 Tax=Sulfurimonas sp. TaxID=2022749 RepID=UPI0025F94968|nr:hypothetical protein [Sulfurimonas sp.]